MVAEGSAEAGEQWRAFVDRQVARGALTRQQADDLTYLAGRGALAASAVGPAGRVTRTARMNRVVIPSTDPRFHFPVTRPTGRVGGGNLSGTPASTRDIPNPKQRAGLERQNETAVILDRAGYGVHQLRERELSADEMRSAGLTPGKNPDYIIEGRIFDNVAPITDRLYNLHDRIKKKVNRGQTHRVIVNLGGSNIWRADVESYLREHPIPGLQEVITIDQQGRTGRAFPRS